jgi:hypothetical protein
MASRVVVHVVGPKADPVAAVAATLRSTGVVIVDQQPNMLLVEGSKASVNDALGQTSGWSVSELTSVPRPRTRPEVLRKP